MIVRLIRVLEVQQCCDLRSYVSSNPGSGGGSVGRAVASSTRDLQFESRHQQNLIYQLYNKIQKSTKQRKRVWEWPIFSKMSRATRHLSWNKSQQKQRQNVAAFKSSPTKKLRNSLKCLCWDKSENFSRSCSSGNRLRSRHLRVSESQKLFKSAPADFWRGGV